MANLKDFKDKDLYKLFEVDENATTGDIRKAYRKKALKHHPDKNPNDSKAAAVFHELSEALKVLVDVGARAAYDHVRKARKTASERTAKLDERRKKVKLDLEAREVEAETRERNLFGIEKQTLKREVERLREDGMRILEEEKIFMKKILKESSLNGNSHPVQLRVKWKKNSKTNPCYTQKTLRNIFGKHGDISNLIMSTKGGSAIVEFSNSNAAKLAYDSEIGFAENPLRLLWISDQPLAGSHSTKYNMGQVKDTPLFNEIGASSAIDDDDFEEQVLKKMRMKQEEKTKP